MSIGLSAQRALFSNINIVLFNVIVPNAEQNVGSEEMERETYYDWQAVLRWLASW